jgi:hypothetical protein
MDSLAESSPVIFPFLFSLSLHSGTVLYTRRGVFVGVLETQTHL